MENSGPDNDLDEAILVALRRIIRAVELHSKRLLQSHGLTSPQLLLLRELAAAGRCPVGQLATRLRLSQPTVTEILARLEKRGLVSRARGEHDRRRVDNLLTAAGEALLATAPPLLQQEFAQRFAELQGWEQTQLLASLQRLAALMDAEHLDAAPLLSSGAASPASEAVAAVLDAG